MARLQASATGGTLTTSAAVLRINREKGVVIDVSEPAEFEQEHVAGARNVPFGQLDGHKQLPSNKGLPWWWCARAAHVPGGPPRCCARLATKTRRP